MESMTQEERNKHRYNICWYLAHSDATIAKIKINMIANGRKVE